MDTEDFKKKKQEELEFGKFAEKMAADLYVKKGYAILERNWFHGKSEIDIIAQNDNEIVFIEVKARKNDDGNPVDAVTRDKMRRMIKASDAYLSKLTGEYGYRFDIVGVSGDMNDCSVEVVENAFFSTDIY